MEPGTSSRRTAQRLLLSRKAATFGPLIFALVFSTSAVAQNVSVVCAPGKQPRGGKFGIALLDPTGRPHPNPPPITDVQFEEFGPITISTPLYRKLTPANYIAVVPFTLSGTLAPYPRIILGNGTSHACQGNVLVLPDYFNVVPSVTGLSPVAAAVGATVTIKGTFYGPVDVWFNGPAFTGVRAFPKPVYPPGWMPGSPYRMITVEVPLGAASGPLTVETSGGAGFWQTRFGAPVPFTVIEPATQPCQTSACLDDFTWLLSITKVGSFQYNRYTREYSQAVLIENPARISIEGPVYVAIDGIAGGTLIGAAGIIADPPPHSPYLLFPALPPEGLTVVVRFSIPSPVQSAPSFTIRVLGRRGPSDQPGDEKPVDPKPEPDSEDGTVLVLAYDDNTPIAPYILRVARYASQQMKIPVRIYVRTDAQKTELEKQPGLRPADGVTISKTDSPPRVDFARDYTPWLITVPAGGAKRKHAYVIGEPDNGFAKDLKAKGDLSGDLFVMPLKIEGGDLLVDKAGNAFITNQVYEKNKPKTKGDVNKLLQDYLGIKPEKIIELTNIPDNSTAHADMLVRPLPNGTVITVDPNTYPAGDPQNTVLAANLVLLKAKLGADKVKAIKNPDTGPTTMGYSYQNAWVHGNTVIIAEFEESHNHPGFFDTFNKEAKQTYADALPGFNVVPLRLGVNAGPLGGGYHCLTGTIGKK